jgi:hypothetical protein
MSPRVVGCLVCLVLTCLDAQATDEEASVAPTVGPVEKRTTLARLLDGRVGSHLLVRGDSHFPCELSCKDTSR